MPLLLGLNNVIKLIKNNTDVCSEVLLIKIIFVKIRFFVQLTESNVGKKGLIDYEAFAKIISK